MAVASLVLGIISLTCGLFGFGFRWGGVILAIAGLIVSSRNKDPEKASMAKAGKICSVIGLILCLLIMVVLFVGAGIATAYVGTGILTDVGEFIRTCTAEFFAS